MNSNARNEQRIRAVGAQTVGICIDPMGYLGIFAILGVSSVPVSRSSMMGFVHYSACLRLSVCSNYAAKRTGSSRITCLEAI